MKKINKAVGEKYITKQGLEVEIIDYFNNKNISVRFEDGTIKTNLEYGNIKKGSVGYPIKSKVGEKFITNEGYEMEIIEYKGSFDITVVLDKNIIINSVNYQAIKNGQVANPFHKSFSYVGYRGIGNHKLSIKGVHTKCGKIWSRMLERGYNKKIKEKYITYKDVTVCEEWHNFQNFAEWFYENYNPETMQDWQLDKDILVKGNKIYSPETCCLVPPVINTLFVKNNINRGSLPIGVRSHYSNYQTSISKYDKSVFLGTFNTPEETFQAYKKAKEQHIKEVAEKYKDKIDPRVYQAMYNYQVEITD